MTLDEKKCKACGMTKPISDFYFKKDRQSYSNSCKRCVIDGVRIPKSDTHKKCKHCGEVKPFTEFQKAGGGKWLQPYCKPCDSARKKVWAKENEDVVKNNSKEYYNDNKDFILKKEKAKREADPQAWRDKGKRWRNANVELKKKRDREYNAKNKEALSIKRMERYYKNHELNLIKQRQNRSNRTPEQIALKKEYDREYKKKNRDKYREWRELNKEAIREQKRIWGNKKAATDIQYRLKRNLRTRIRCALKPSNAYKVDKSENLLGCTIEFYKSYLADLFTIGMNWDKFMEGKIEIDHIKPCKLFDLTKEEEQRACFNYKNTQPLWVEDNLIKGSKYKEEMYV